MLIIAILLPPLSFFLRGKIIQGIISSILWIIMVLLGFSGLGLIIAIPLETILIIWAVVSRVNGKNDKKLKELEMRMQKSQIANQY